MRRTALLGLVAVFTASSLNATPSSAQQSGFPLYPWCAYYGNGRTNCYFSTFEQCRAAISGGVGGMCSQNSWYAAYGPYYSFGGGQPPRRLRRSQQY